ASPPTTTPTCRRFPAGGASCSASGRWRSSMAALRSRSRRTAWSHSSAAIEFLLHRVAHPYDSLHVFTCQTARQTCGIGPWLGLRALGSARSLLPFLLPQCEEVARQGRRAHGYPWAARVLPGDLAQEA